MLEVIRELRQLFDLVLVLLVEGLQLLVDRLKLLARSFELLHRRAKLFVRGLKLLVRCTHLLLAGLELLHHRLEAIACDVQLCLELTYGGVGARLGLVRGHRRLRRRLLFIKRDEDESFQLAVTRWTHTKYDVSLIAVDAERYRT